MMRPAAIIAAMSRAQFPARVSREKPMFRAAAAVLCLAVAGAWQPAMAQAERPTLTVYTYGSFAGEYGPGAIVKERFESRCGCTLEWVATDDAGTLLARLKLEGEGTRADVVLGLDTNLMAEAEATGLFAPHGVSITDLALPVEWTSGTFLPFDWGWFAFVYDETRLPKPPLSLAELVDAEDGPKIVIEDPRTSTPGLGLIL
jgi:thiamine transport system substrate-binding protein